MNARATGTMVLLCLLLLPAPPGRAAEPPGPRESCRVCGMWIDEYEHTAATLVRKDGTTEHTCGVACMLRIVEEEGLGTFESVKVHGWATRGEVDATGAYYSVGSEVVPDMLPNYIAFATREEAEEFSGTRGGIVLDFGTALDRISPRGLTQPFRIRQAVTPGRGAFGAGVAYAYLKRSQILVDTTGYDPRDFIAANPAQPKAPDELVVQTQALVLNYGVTDRLAALLNFPYSERQGTIYERDGGAIRKVEDTRSGFGDVGAELRYNLWRSAYFDRFFTLLGGMTLPSGYFDDDREPNLALGGREFVSTPPGMQLGTGTVSIYGGLLYSQQLGDFWLHGQALYRVNPENPDDYKFGNETNAGIALHYTPHYDLMVGLEADVVQAQRNEDDGFAVGNTGGIRTNLAAVFDWRFLNALGGNFSLRFSAGLPLYEDLNAKALRTPMGKSIQQVQLGEGFFANAVVNYSTRFNLFE